VSGGRDPIKVGIIGVGWGSIVQIPAFGMVPPFEVRALCSRRLDRVQAAGERHGIGDVSTDWQTFVKRDDLDLISICTPTDLHFEQAMGAIAAGKHLLVEKPVGVDATQTQAMLEAAETAEVCHAVCFEGRWDPARLRVWDLVREGVLGQPYLALARSGGDFWHPTRALQSEWMYRRSDGGGYLMGLGSHDIDYCCALFGAPTAVCADVLTSVPTRRRDDGTVLPVDADDTAALLLRMENGMLVNIVTTAIAFGQNFRTFEGYGSKGSLTIDGLLMGEEATDIHAASIDDPGLTTVAASDRMPRSRIELPKRRAAGAIRSLALMLEDWLPAFDGEATCAPTLRDGDRVQSVVDAALASHAGAGWVTLL
jgi:predicted dehydrogenase